MICPNCQKNLPEEVSFCDACGTKIENQPTEAGAASKDDFPPEVRFLVDMPFEDVERLRNASRKIVSVGELAYFVTILFALSFVVILFPIGWSASLIYLLFFSFFLWADGVLYCKIRTSFARKVILFKLFWCFLSNLLSFLLILLCLFLSNTDTIETIEIYSEVIAAPLFTLWFWSAYKDINNKKNEQLFGDNAPSYKQLNFFYKKKKNGESIIAADVPKNNAPTKTAKFWSVCSLISTILFILCVIIGIFLPFFNSKENLSPEKLFEQAQVELQKGNNELGVSYLEKAANQGHPQAIIMFTNYIFSVSDLKHPGTEKMAYAFRLLNQDSMRENHEALFSLGVLYFRGFGTQQDFNKAAECLSKSADMGNESAMNFLGYQNGVRPNFDRPLPEVLREYYEYLKQQESQE